MQDEGELKRHVACKGGLLARGAVKCLWCAMLSRPFIRNIRVHARVYAACDVYTSLMSIATKKYCQGSGTRVRPFCILRHIRLALGGPSDLPHLHSHPITTPQCREPQSCPRTKGRAKNDAQWVHLRQRLVVYLAVSPPPSHRPMLWLRVSLQYYQCGVRILH